MMGALWVWRGRAVHAKRVVDVELLLPRVLQEVVGERRHVAHALQGETKHKKLHQK